MKKVVAYIKSQYAELGRELAKNNGLVFLVCMVFIECIIFACLNMEADPHYLEYLEKTEPKYNSVFWLIFIENSISSILTAILGMFPFFVGTLYESYSIAAGFITTVKLFMQKIPLKYILFGIAPHGIFEMSAIVFSLIISAVFSREMSRIFLKWILKDKLRYDEKLIPMIFVIRGLLLVVIPLLFVGAVVEITVSPILLNNIFN